MRKKLIAIIILAFIIGCNTNNEGEIVNSFTNRINKIKILSTSDNASTYSLSALEDSIQILKLDLNQLNINNENKSQLSNLIESVYKEIRISRMIKCIVGETYSYVHKKPGGDEYSDIFYGNSIFTKVFLNNENNCTITSNYNGDFMSSVRDAFRTALTGRGNGAKSKKGTYKYIGNDEFQISNGWIIKVTDLKNCNSKIISR